MSPGEHWLWSMVSAQTITIKQALSWGTRCSTKCSLITGTQISSYFISVLLHFSLSLTEFSYVSISCNCLFSSGYKLFTLRIELKAVCHLKYIEDGVIATCLTDPPLCKAGLILLWIWDPQTTALGREAACGLCRCQHSRNFWLDHSLTPYSISPWHFYFKKKIIYDVLDYRFVLFCFTLD